MTFSWLIAYFQHWPTITPTVWIVVAFISSALVGVFSGFYPAWKASKLDPIEALHYE
jgi:putative ABC transport system permease protein